MVPRVSKLARAVRKKLIIFNNSRRRYMAKMLPILHKTPRNQSINQSYYNIVDEKNILFTDN